MRELLLRGFGAKILAPAVSDYYLEGAANGGKDCNWDTGVWSEWTILYDSLGVSQEDHLRHFNHLNLLPIRRCTTAGHLPLVFKVK